MGVLSKLYFGFCEHVLFIRLFKKYWPVKGSFWNKIHINKNDRTHLKEVIDEAWSFTQHHLPVFLGLGSFRVYLSFFPSESTSYVSHKSMLHFFLAWELYALNAHLYNRLKAKEQLDLLERQLVCSKDGKILQVISDLEKKLDPENVYFDQFDFPFFSTWSHQDRLTLLTFLLKEQEEELVEKEKATRPYIGTHIWLSIRKDHAIYWMIDRIRKTRVGPYFPSLEEMLTYRQSFRANNPKNFFDTQTSLSSSS